MRLDDPAGMRAMQGALENPDPALAALARRLEGWDFSGIELRPPTTLVEDRLELNLDDIDVQLIYVGPAHTASDLIVHLPSERVVFTGDILFRRCTPICWEGTYRNWIEALEFIIKLAPEVVVPGHGPICGIEGLREMKAYLEYVRSESTRLYEAGLPL